MARGRTLVGLVAFAALAGSGINASASATETPAPAVRFHHGSVDLGDPLVPGYGNGGYDVSHYGIFLSYATGTRYLVGRTVITARLTENLSRFNLDFALPVRSVTVNGATATFKTIRGPKYEQGKELVVTPAKGLPAGSTMTVVVTYAAHPFDVLVGGTSEWSTTVTGITVLDDPAAASEWWYPGNAYPSDKATYDVRVTTSKGVKVITNGALLSRVVHGVGATTHWREVAPMSSYLSFLNIGRYDVARQTILDGTPAYFAYEHTGTIYVQRARRDVSKAPSILARLQNWFGPYPFPVAGAIVSQTDFGTAMETQTRPTYTALFWQSHARNVWVVVHELSHQWFGDDVTYARWRHVWLSEGFATYAEWLWSGAHGRGTTEQLFEANYQEYPKGDDFWTDPVIHSRYVFGVPSYERGAMTLQALRNRVGTTAFFTILRTYLASYRHGNATSGQFAAVASKISGQDLDAFFRVWLESTHRPAPLPRNGFPHQGAAGLASGAVPVPVSFAGISRTDALLARN